MVHENPSNIKGICRTCAEDRLEETQENIDQIIDNIENATKAFVKKCFTDGEYSEHMWVQVTDVNRKLRTIVGTLDNEPVAVQNVRYGDTIVVTFEEIEDCIAARLDA